VHTLKTNSRRHGVLTLLTTGLMVSTLGALALGASSVAAQSVYPAKPIRLVVPFTPGGVTDTSGRLIAEHLSKRTQLVATSEPDGYTLLLGFDGTMVINPHVFPKVGFDTLKDFAPIGKIGDAILILVSHPGVPAKSLKEVIALSKTQAGGLSFGTSGTGGTPHIAGELLKQRTGANLTHIPYKGGGQAMTDVLGGNIPLVYTAVAGAVQHIKSGKLHPVAVSSAQRASSLPDVPTFIENGVTDFDINSWVGLLAPAKTPKAIVDKLNAELNAVLNDPVARERLNVLGITASPGSAEKLGQDMQRDLVRYGAVVKAANIKVE
jgi:tripartite-type tricarboxylate transporter receptor subunit TctC